MMISVAVKGLIVRDGRVLLIQRSGYDDFAAGTWEFAGGKIEFGEGLEGALVREAKEETGLDVEVLELLYATSFVKSESRQTVILSYLCATKSDAVTLSNEHTDYVWADAVTMRGSLSKMIVDDLDRNEVWVKLEKYM